MTYRGSSRWIAIVVVAVNTTVAFAQTAPNPASSPPPHLNSYYRSPLIVTGEYHSWTPFGDYASEFTVFEAVSTLRFSPRGRPGFQPLLRAGYLDFNSNDEEFPDKWDHYHASAGAGFALSSRFSRNFEVAGELSAAYSQTWFDNLVEEPVGYSGLIGAAGARISLIPSFNFSIDVAPQLRYLYGLGEIDRFDGLSFAIGFGASFRTGRDPDAPQTEIRSIRFGKTEIPPAFAALQSWYVDNAIGSVVFANGDTRAIQNVEVLFLQNGFMDSPTPASRIDEIGPGEEVTVDLTASFNSEVFETEGVTPLTGEVIVRYTRDGRAAEQRQSVTYDLHDKTALTWTDDRKMGAFVTPSDSAVRNYASYIRRQNRELTLDGVSQALQTAVLIYHALEELGIYYQVDPTNPFTQVQGDTTAVDSISLPRDTLSRLTGDCDDLTALYCTMLESAGFETAFMTTPGHIYVAVNTGVSAADYAEIHPDRRRTLVVNDTVWVPVEITMLGRGDFVEAWRYGIDEWHKVESTPAQRGFFLTREAQALYRPVGLRQTDLGLQYGDMTSVARKFERSLQAVSADVLAEVRAEAESQNSDRAWNRYGVLAARWGQYSEARNAFNRSASLDPEYVSPRINLGSVSFLEEDYRGALSAFESARNAVETARRVRAGTRATVYVNLARAQYELGQNLEAQRNYSIAAEADADVASQFSYLGRIDTAAGGAVGSDPSGGIGIASAGDIGTAAGTGRASQAVQGPVILFAEDE